MSIDWIVDESDLLCLETIKKEDKDMDVVEMYEDIVGSLNAFVRPTSFLENWCVNRGVPDFGRLPDPWITNTAIRINKTVRIKIGAFCRKKRLCICFVNNSTTPVCVDADELFESDHVIDLGTFQLERATDSFPFSFMKTTSIAKLVSEL